MKKVKSVDIKLKEVRKYQNVFRGNLKKDKKGNFKSEEQHKIFKCFTIQETKSLTYIFILQLHLRLIM